MTERVYGLANIRNEIIQLQFRLPDELDLKAEQWTI